MMEFIEKAIEFKYDDGGREEAGYKGKTGDCVTRSIAIATGIPYKEVYDTINKLSASERVAKKTKSKSNARTGVYKKLYHEYLLSLGFEWVPTMSFGQGCSVHLKASELPMGTIIVRLSKHIAAVIDRTLHDTYDCSRNGTRCVYGYWSRD